MALEARRTALRTVHHAPAPAHRHATAGAGAALHALRPALRPQSIRGAGQGHVPKRMSPPSGRTLLGRPPTSTPHMPIRSGWSVACFATRQAPTAGRHCDPRPDAGTQQRDRFASLDTCAIDGQRRDVPACLPCRAARVVWLWNVGVAAQQRSLGRVCLPRAQYGGAPWQARRPRRVMSSICPQEGEKRDPRRSPRARAPEADSFSRGQRDRRWCSSV